MGVGMRRL